MCISINLLSSNTTRSSFPSSYTRDETKSQSVCQCLCFIFHRMMNDRCYVGLCASVLACCMYRCLHASTLPFCRPLPHCCNSCSAFTIVAQKNTTRVLFPNVGGWRSLTRLIQSPPLLCHVVKWIIFIHIFIPWFLYYADFRLPCCCILGPLGILEVQGGSPLPLTLTKSRWPWLGWAAWMSPYCLWM